MVSKIINEWLEQGLTDLTKERKEVRLEDGLIPILKNKHGNNQTPKPLFPSFLDEKKLEPDFLPIQLVSIEKKFLHSTSINLDKPSSKFAEAEIPKGKEEIKRVSIEYARTSIFLARVMFNLFEMPDSSVSKGSALYNKVLERNELYQTALEQRQKFPQNYKQESIQTDIIETYEKGIETVPVAFEDKGCMINTYLLKEHYNRKEIKVKPPPKTFNEFMNTKIKFKDYPEFLANICNYPEILVRLQEALYVTEKTVNYNTYKNSILKYNGCETDTDILNKAFRKNEDSTDLFIDDDNKKERSEEFGIKQHLFFHLEKLQSNYQVNCIECSQVNPSIFVSGYGVSQFEEMNHDPRGVVLCWNIHKCGYPEKIYYTEEIVTCLEFSKTEPYLVAVGMRYGLIAIFDLRKADVHSSINNYSSKVKPTGTIKNIRWLKRKYAMAKEIEVLLSVSMDGKICSWTRGRVLDGQVMRYVKRGVNDKEQRRMVVAIDATGMSMQFKPESNEIFLIGTIEGQALQADINDPDSYMYIYNCHNGPLYDLQWSPLVTDVFMTCGTDRFIHIWQVGRRKPSKSLTLQEIAVTVTWSCMKSTLFAAMCKSKILFFDLSIDLHKAIIEYDAKKNSTFTFFNFCPKNNWFLAGQSDGSIELNELKDLPELTISQTEALKSIFLSDY